LRPIHCLLLLLTFLTCSSVVAQKIDSLTQVDSVYRVELAALQSSIDSLGRLNPTDSVQRLYEQKLKQLEVMQGQLDEFRLFEKVEDLPTIKSLAIPDNLHLPEVAALNSEMINAKIPRVDSLSGLLNTAEAKLENELANRAEMDYLQQQRSEYDRLAGMVDQSAFKGRLDDAKGKMVSQAKGLVQGHASKIQALQTRASALKQTYSNVISSEDLESATRQSSLADQPWGRRVLFGGNISFPSLDPFSVDAQPMVGYRINKFFHVGISGVYRMGWKVDTTRLTIHSMPEKVYGFSGFLSHAVWKQFLIYGEAEKLYADGSAESRKRVGEAIILAGVGRTFRINAKVNLQLLVLYNFNHSDSGFLTQPIQIKTGFTFHK